MSATAALLLGDELLDTKLPRKPQKRRTPEPSEAQIVSSIRSRLFIAGIMSQVNANEAMSKAFGRALRIKGTVSGFPDLSVIGPGGRVAWFEVKRPSWRPRLNAKDAEHWARQEACHQRLRALGHLVAVVRSQDQAVQVLREAGWPI